MPNKCDILNCVCHVLGCDYEDIIEYVPDEEQVD